MDPIDPRRAAHPRRAGTRRLRLATAVVAGGAAVGTGALTVLVAAEHPAAAAESGTTAGSTAGTSSGSSVQDQRPGRPGGLGGSTGGGPHASSGGS